MVQRLEQAARGRGIDRRAERLASIKGKFLMSINDVAAIREQFRPFRIRQVDTTYCSHKITNTKVRELLISNY